MTTGLIIGSGGVKGYLLLGGLSFLAKNNFLKNIKHICGISSGSIIALLYMCGYTPQDMLKLSLNLSLSNFDISQILTISTKLITQGYLYEISPLIKQLDSYLRAHNFINTTFMDLYNYTNIKFTVVAYDLTIGKKVYFSHETHPDMICLDAIRLSCALPIIFDEQKYANHCFLDGAFVSPCPVDIFDEHDEVIAMITETDVEKTRTSISVINKIVDIFEAAIKEKIDSCIEKARCKYKIIKFRSDTFGPLSSNLTDSIKRSMFVVGYENACLNI